MAVIVMVIVIVEISPLGFGGFFRETRNGSAAFLLKFTLFVAEKIKICIFAN